MWRMCALQCVCVCVCAVIHLLQLVYSTVSRERRRLPWSFLSQMLLRNRWVFFINGWRIAALLATQHTGQPKLRESDNSVTAHQPVVSKQSCLLCAGMARSKNHTGRQLLGKMKWQQSGWRTQLEIFSNISPHFFCFRPVAICQAGMGKVVNKQKKCTYHSCHSFFQSPTGSGLLLTPYYALSPNAFWFFFFVFITRQRPELVGRPKGIGRYLASVVSS